MSTETLTLTDFLLARLEEQEEREIAEACDQLAEEHQIPANRRDEFATVHEKTLHISVFRLNRALARAGWAMALAPPLSLLLGPAARQRAAEFSDHPDYNPDWRP